MICEENVARMGSGIRHVRYWWESQRERDRKEDLDVDGRILQGFFFCNLILFARSTSTFNKLCKNMYTVACRRVLSRAPL
jgi:hypothetical protein